MSETNDPKRIAISLRISLVSVIAILAFSSIAILFKQPILSAACIFAASVSAAFIIFASFRFKVFLRDSIRVSQELKLRQKNSDTLLQDLCRPLELLAAEDLAIISATDDARTPLSAPDPHLPAETRLRAFADGFSASISFNSDRLKAFRSFSEYTGRLKEIELRFPYVETLHARVIMHTEQAALALVDKFGAIAERTDKAAADAKNAMATLGSGSDNDTTLDALIRKSHESVIGRTSVIKEFLKLNRENADRVRKISDLVKRSEELIGGIEDIAERSKLITFNLAIESAKIGEKGLGFKVIVTELQRLNDQTTSFAHDILDIVKLFHTHNQELLDQWLGKSERLTEQVRSDTDRAEEAVTALSRSYELSSALFRSLSESAIEVDRSMNDVLASLQFQDITRQQIESTDTFLNDMRSSITYMRTSLETEGFEPENTSTVLNAIRTNYRHKIKVSSDLDIFDLIERRMK
ncbi:MAG: hypothetical protein A2413_10100 [Treponema sp. RIFOXYC1_FULL_61_9]|nr:MAG: hypothetical protein A2413_10100 [Treponema sp. RIFOXYC1_FULL_61_9]